MGLYLARTLVCTRLVRVMLRDPLPPILERAAELGSIPVTMQAFDSSKMPEEKSVITFVAYLCARLLDSCKEIRATLRIQNYYRAYYARTHLVWRNAAARPSAPTCLWSSPGWRRS